jgi:hypothetical protein
MNMVNEVFQIIRPETSSIHILFFIKLNDTLIRAWIFKAKSVILQGFLNGFIIFKSIMR